MEHQTDQAYDADALQNLYSQTMYRLREARKLILRQYGLASEAQLLEQITAGAVPEHPAYEHYLSALIIEQTRQQVRAQAVAQLGGIEDAQSEAISIHLMLQQHIETHYAARLAEPVRLAQDALLLSFDSGVLLEVRYANAHEYAISWRWGEAEQRIDTAPVHPDCASVPQHWHDDNGLLRSDPITVAGAPCWPNLRRLIDALLVDPMCGSASDTE